MLENTYETYQPDYYCQFKEIEKASFRDIIHFYELYENQLSRLDVHKRFDIKITYCYALFEVGKYSEFLYHIDDLIETVIYNNIYSYKGKDIYQELLFKKAAALYQIRKIPKAQKILIQLIQMDPDHKSAIFLRKKCQLTQSSAFYRNMKGLSILLFLLSALITSVEILLVKPFYPEWEKEIEMLRTLFFIGGTTVLVGSTLIHRILSFQKVNREVGIIRTERKNEMNYLDKKVLKSHSS